MAALAETREAAVFVVCTRGALESGNANIGVPDDMPAPATSVLVQIWASQVS